MTTLSSRLDKNWRDIIDVEFDRSKMEGLEQFLRRERARHTVYPKDAEIFNALNLTAFDDVKVVIIGQDPYHAKGQAHGLCFSVPKGIEKIPRSLRNIYKEIEKEYCPMEMPSDGDLTGWAKQGVLLLNATLTVREAEPRSHEGQGWEEFTDAIIRAVNKKREPVVFLLWGLGARAKAAQIDGKKHGGKKHLVLETSHPSPLSARRGFIGCGHFKRANDYLIEHRLKPIEWH